MIHLNKWEDAPHEWITDEEFKNRYPELHRIINTKTDEKEHGQKLKAMRLKRRITIWAMSQLSGFLCAEICDFENGRRKITPEINDRYCLALSKSNGSEVPHE